MLDFRTQPVWPDPEDSIGGFCVQIGRKCCWEPTGPALVAFKELSVKIEELFRTHKELIIECEEISWSLKFLMWMVGRTEKTAKPTIVFASKSKPSRLKALHLVKQSNLLAEYPGIALKALEVMPAIPRASSLQATEIRMLQPYQPSENDASNPSVILHASSSDHPRTHDALSRDWGEPRQTSNENPDDSPLKSNDSIYAIGSLENHCGAPLLVGESNTATLGGVVSVNRKHYGLTAHHSRTLDQSKPLCYWKTATLKFDDDDSDEESDVDDDDFDVVTSRASISSASDSEPLSSPDSDSSHTPLELGAQDGTAEETSSPIHIKSTETVPLSPDLRDLPMLKIGSLSSSLASSDLDYNLFPLQTTDATIHNEINIQSEEACSTKQILIQGVARELTARKIFVATGTTGVVSGSMQESPHFLQIENSRHLQEVWAVRLDREILAGDSGSWVIDASTGELCGHIVASDPLTGLGYVVPAHKVFDDIKKHLGSAPVLPSHPSLETSTGPQDPLSHRAKQIIRNAATSAHESIQLFTEFLISCSFISNQATKELAHVIDCLCEYTDGADAELSFIWSCMLLPMELAIAFSNSLMAVLLLTSMLHHVYSIRLFAFVGYYLLKVSRQFLRARKREFIRTRKQDATFQKALRATSILRRTGIESLRDLVIIHFQIHVEATIVRSVPRSGGEKFLPSYCEGARWRMTFSTIISKLRSGLSYLVHIPLFIPTAFREAFRWLSSYQDTAVRFASESLTPSSPFFCLVQCLGSPISAATSLIWEYSIRKKVHEILLNDQMIADSVSKYESWVMNDSSYDDLHTDSMLQRSEMQPKRRSYRDGRRLWQPLRERHINYIAFSTCIGIGIFVRFSQWVSIGGPGSVLIAYALLGMIVWSVINSIAEMVSVRPLSRSLLGLPKVLHDESIVSMILWTSWILGTALVASLNFTLAGSIKSLIDNSPSRLQSDLSLTASPNFTWQYPPLTWVIPSFLLIGSMNLLSAKWYGFIERVFVWVKLGILIRLTLTSFLYGYFATSKEPSCDLDISPGTIFLFSVLNVVGFEVLLLTTGGPKPPEKANPPEFTDRRRSYYRAMWSSLICMLVQVICGINTFSLLAAGPFYQDTKTDANFGTDILRTYSGPILFLAFYMTYKWFHLSRIWNLGNSHRLISTCILSAPIWGLGRSSVLLLPSGGHSPFVIVLDTWDRLVLWKMPLTLLFLCSAMSSCLDILYSSSRILHALAINSQPWPEWDWCQMFRRRLQRTTRRGVPVTAVCVTWLLGFLFCVVSWRKGGGSTMTG